MANEENKTIMDHIIKERKEQEIVEQQRIEQERLQSMQQVQNIVPNEIDTSSKDFSRFMGHDDDERLQNTRPQGDSTYVGEGINHLFKDYDIGVATQDAWNDVSMHDTTLFTNIEDFAKDGQANPDILFSDIMYNKDSSDIVNAGSINEGMSNRDVRTVREMIRNDSESLYNKIDTLQNNYLDSMFAPDKSGFDTISTNQSIRDIFEKHADEIVNTGVAKLSNDEITKLGDKDNNRWKNGLTNNNEIRFDTKQQDIIKDHMAYKADYDRNMTRATDTLNNFKAAVQRGSLSGLSRTEIQRATTLIAGMSLKDNKISELNNLYKDGKVSLVDHIKEIKETNNINARLGEAHGNNGHAGRVNTTVRTLEHGFRDRDGSDFTGDETRNAIMEARQIKHMVNDAQESRARHEVTKSRRTEDRVNRDNHSTKAEKELAKRQRERAEEYQAKRHERQEKYYQNDETERLDSRLKERDARAAYRKSQDDLKREKRNRRAEEREKRSRNRGNDRKADRIKAKNDRQKDRDKRKDEQRAQRLERQKDRDERRSRFAIGRRFNDFRTRHWWASPGLHARNAITTRLKGSRLGGFISEHNVFSKLKVFNPKQLLMDFIRDTLKPLILPGIINILILMGLLFFVGVIATMFGGSDKEEKRTYTVKRYQQIADSMADTQYDFQEVASKGAQEAVRSQAGSKDIKNKLKAKGVKTYDAFDVDVNRGQTRHIVDEYGNEKDTMNTFIPILAMSKYRIFAQLDDTNTKKVTRYANGLWTGSDNTNSSYLTGTKKEDVHGKGDKAYLKSTGAKKFSYQKWVGNEWLGANHTVKYFPDYDENGNKEDTIKFNSDGSWFGSMLGNDAECAYGVEHHDHVKDCPQPGHHGGFFTKGQKVIDTTGDGNNDTDIDNKYVSKTKVDECDGSVPMRGTAKYRLHKHTDDCYKTVYVYNGISYNTIEEANNAKQGNEAHLSSSAKNKLNAFNSEMNKQVNAFKAKHPNYDDYIMKHIGSYSETLYYDFIMSVKDSNSSSGQQTNDTSHKRYTISNVSNIYSVWTGASQERVNYNSRTSSLKDAYDRAAGTNSGTVSVEKDYNQVVCGMEEHYDKQYFKDYKRLRLNPWHSESNPGDFETWYECKGHCPGHITPYVDYAFVGDVDNLMAYDETRMSELKSMSQKLHNGFAKEGAKTINFFAGGDKENEKDLENVLGFKDSMWNHWDEDDKSVIHDLIGDYDSGYEDGKDLLEELGIKTQSLGTISKEEQAAFEGALNKSVGNGGRDPEKTKAMLSYAESLWAKHSYHYAMDGRRAKDPYLDCSSFVGMVINNAWGPSSGVSRASTTDTFLHLPGTGKWSSISQVKSGSILLGKNSNIHHVVLAVSVQGNNITYIECNIAYGGMPDGINVRTEPFSFFKNKTYTYDYINNDFAS